MFLPLAFVGNSSHVWKHSYWSHLQTTIITPSQCSFLGLSSHFWIFLASPRKPCYVSNKSFHVLLLFMWCHQPWHPNQIFDGGPSCFFRVVYSSKRFYMFLVHDALSVSLIFVMALQVPYQKILRARISSGPGNSAR